MADTVKDHPPVPRRKPALAPKLLPPLIFAVAVFLGADMTAVESRPAHYLQIPYLKAMDYSHLIVPAACALIWLVTRWKWPHISAFICVSLCFVLLSQVPSYYEGLTARIPVSRSLTWEERQAFEARVPFRICESSSSYGGNKVYVAPANELPAREQLQQFGVLTVETAE